MIVITPPFFFGTVSYVHIHNINNISGEPSYADGLEHIYIHET